MIYASRQIFVQPRVSADSPVRDGSAEANGFMAILDKSLHSYRASPEPRKASDYKNTGMSQAHSAKSGHELNPKTPVVSANPRYNAKTEAKSGERAGISGSGKNAETESVSGETDTGPVKAVDSENDEILKQSIDIQCIMDEIIALLKNFTLLIDDAQTRFNSDTSLLAVNRQETVQLLQSLEASLARLLQIGKPDGSMTAEAAADYAGRFAQALNEIFAELSVDEVIITVQNPDRLKELVSKMLNETEHAKMNIAVNLTDETVVSGKQTDVAADFSENSAGAIEQAEKAPDIREESEDSNDRRAFQRSNDEGSGQQMKGGRAVTAAPRHHRQELASAADAEAIPLPGEALNPVQDAETVAAATEKAPVVLKHQVLQQVIEKSDMLQHEGKSEMVMQLKPESLGKISLRLIHERGEIVARFVAENEQVKAILESNMQLLRDSLQRSGVSVQSLSVSVGQHDQRQGADSRNRWNEEPGMGGRITQTGTGRLTAMHAYLYRGLNDDLLQPGESEINLTA